MKLIASLFLVFFIGFLITPAVVSLLEDDCDTCMFVKISDEEDLTAKEILINTYSPFISNDFLLPERTNLNLILSENLSKHDNVSKKIVSPPPDFA